MQSVRSNSEIDMCCLSVTKKGYPDLFTFVLPSLKGTGLGAGCNNRHTQGNDSLKLSATDY